MPVLIPRIRTIGVRLSEEEYSNLERYCVEHRARSMSDLARTAICNLVNDVTEENALATVVNHYAAQVKELEEKVRRLNAEIASLQSKTTGYDHKTAE